MWKPSHQRAVKRLVFRCVHSEQIAAGHAFLVARKGECIRVTCLVLEDKRKAVKIRCVFWKPEFRSLLRGPKKGP